MWGSNPGVKDTGKSTGGTKREVGKWDLEEGGSGKNREFFATLHYILQWKKQKEGEGTKEVAQLNMQLTFQPLQRDQIFIFINHRSSWILWNF